MTKQKAIHLFYISNYISFTNYLSIIIEKNISIKDCYFYSPRLSTSELNINTKLNLVKGLNFTYPKNKIERFFIFYLNKKNDSLLRKKIDNSKFYFYTPHLINYREKIIIASKNCIKYFFIEEGIPSYRNDFKINCSNTFTKIGVLSNYKNKLDSVFRNHEHSFDFSIKNEIIPLSFVNKFKKEIIHNIKNNDIVIAIDSFKTNLKFNNYIISYIKLLNHLKSNDNHKIKLKFHPDYVYEPSYMKMFEEINQSLGMDYEILKNNVFVEEIASLGVKINLYCIFSSLYIYLAQNNSKVFIFDDYLRENDEAYFDIYSINKKIIEKLGLDVNFIRLK